MPPAENIPHPWSAMYVPTMQPGNRVSPYQMYFIWWRHQMKTFSVLLAICAGNSPVTGEFPAQRPETRSFDDFFDLRMNKRLSKQSPGWWFEAPSRSLWRYCNDSWLKDMPLHPSHSSNTLFRKCAIDKGRRYSYFVWIVHDDVTPWKRFPRYSSFVRGIDCWPVDSPNSQ